MAERENQSLAAEVHLRQAALAETELVKMKRIQSLLLSEAQPELAVKYVNQSETHHPNDLIRAMNQALLAVAQHELEHSDAAGSALEEASQLITGHREIPGNQIHPDLLIAEILFREAEVRITGNDAPSSKADQ